MRKRKIVPGFVALLTFCLLTAFSGIAYAEDECMDCHGEKDLEPVTEGRSAEGLYVAPGVLKGSVHEDLSCTECHQSDSEAEKPHHEGGPTPKLLCVECHEDAVNEYNTEDIHGKLHKQGRKDAASCADCHGDHQILPSSSEKSPMHPLKQIETCGKCHNDEMAKKSGAKNGISKRKLVERYVSGIHWTTKKDGNPAAACADCHGSHGVKSSKETTKADSINNCKGCHKEAVENFSKGSHGMALLQGNPDVPDCVDCHGDHDVVSLSAQDGKRDYAATQVCIWCHTNKRLMGRYGMDTSQAENYMNDFHGLAQRSSLGATATCADCHDAHKSLNHENPASSMHLDNRKDACAKCHGDTSEAFVTSFTHKHTTGDESRFVINRIVTIVYILLIIAVIGGMLLHNLIIWSFYVRRKFRSQQKSKCKVVRMNGFERIWHWALFFSFTLLGITGFALVYPDSWVFSWMFDSFLSEQSRAWMHRAAAIVMCLDMGIFLVYKTVTSHGRKRWWKEMFPGWHDIKDVIVTMTYHLGITKEKPLYRVFNYAEKAEYWALWWGTLVMAVTGFVLWFSHLLPAGTPDWLLDISLTIHFYEAVLACMSIAVWHFFFVIYHPEEYPVNLSSITGRLTDHEAEERFTKEAIKIQEEE